MFFSPLDEPELTTCIVFLLLLVIHLEKTIPRLAHKPTKNMTKASIDGLDPLKDFLGDIVTRLEALEAKVGTTPSNGNKHPASAAASAPEPAAGSGGESPAVKAYDAYMKSAVIPLAKACDDLGGLENMGQLIQDAFEGVRNLVVLASRSKAPDGEIGPALLPYFSKTQEAGKKIRTLKVDRDWDRHCKAINELLAVLSWAFQKPPQQLPVPFVKEVLGSAEFWSNRIRKDYKGKDDTQIAFCDNIKNVVNELAAYIQEFHKTGLAFNPRGVSLAEAAAILSDEPATETPKSPVPPKRHPTLGSGGGANLAGLMSELNKRKSQDGTSAATGLKHVTKDQQTWRKEFKGGDAAPKVPVTPSLDAPAPMAAQKKKTPLRGIPIFEYQDRGFKWAIENHTKDSVMKEVSKDGVVTVEVTDPKQQVYIYNCEEVTVKVNGKFKNLILDKCVKCNVVFESLISSTEVVNSKKVQIQVTGVCPVFTIDKTTNVLVWLSEESKSISTFTTSLSSEMNVNFPDGDDMKELPIPEQFVHKLTGSSLTSEVSDLYH